MAYVPVPKDLTKVKTKVMFNLTRRQLVCFTAGALVGVPLFLWLREPAGNSMAAMCMMLVMMPFFLLAMYEKHGQPLEKIVGNILKVAVIRPKQRPYQTNNFWKICRRFSPGRKRIPHERKRSHRQSRRRSICWWTFRQNCRQEKVLVMLDGLKFSI